jgi:hypothetical protein
MQLNLTSNLVFNYKLNQGARYKTVIKKTFKKQLKR